MSEIRYIPDKEVNLSELDLLGSLVYVETIQKIIENCETPYTIGLFGSWGSGKSSIIKTIKENLNNDKSKKVKVFYYDAWKYSKDDFRRTFILELRKSFNLDTKEEEELFYKDKVEDVQFKPKFDKGFVIIFVIFTFLLLIIWYCFFGREIKSLIGSVSLSAFISLFLSFLRSTIIFHRVAITTSKLFAPEKFEERFKNTIDEIKKRNLEKIVIAIDNIDRCHMDQAFEILLTIKNFLGIEGVIFLIPVDDKGLKEYLQMNDKDANEFLRKIFNTTIHIKNFSDSELYDFGEKLLEKYGIDLPRKENVISIICQEFSRNPRRIIQFLNTLQTEYHLAKLQEEKGFIPSGVVTDNIEMLVKILIIREEYPKIFEKISDNKNFLREVNEAIREGRVKFEKGVYKIDGGRLDNFELTEEQYRFLLRTSNIDLDSARLESFFINRDLFKDFPDLVYSPIISQDWNAIKELLKTGVIELGKLIDFIDKLTNEDVIKRNLYDTSGYNLASLIFKIIANEEYGVQIGQLPKNIIAMLYKKEIYKHIFNFPPKEFSYALKWFKERGYNVVLDRTIERLNELRFEELRKDRAPIPFFKAFIITFISDPDVLERIKRKFSELLSKDFSLYADFEEIINGSAVKYLLDDGFASSMIQTLQSDYRVGNTSEKVKVIRALYENGVLKGQTIDQFLNRAIQFIQQNYGNHDILSFWFKAISGFVEKAEDQNVISSLFNFSNNNYSRLLASEVSELFTGILRELYLVIDDSRKRHIVDWLENHFNSRVNEVYQWIIDKTDNWLFADRLIDRMVVEGNQGFKTELVKTVNKMLLKTNESGGLNDKQINKVIKHYFDLLASGNKNASDWIMEICENDFIADKVFDYIKDKDEAMLERSKGIIKYLVNKFGFDRFYERIRELLASSEISKRKSGVSLLYEIKEKVPDDKVNLILTLLYDIKGFEGEMLKKLNELKEFFNYKLKSLDRSTLKS
jgi:GTPase SAR1 family protein